MLRIAGNGEKIDQRVFHFFFTQTRVPKNFRWCRWGAKRRVKRAQTRERGPPSAPAEFFFIGPSEVRATSEANLGRSLF